MALQRVHSARRVACLSIARKVPAGGASPAKLDALKQLEQKLIWLSTYIIHNANVIRPKRDGIKVASISWRETLRPPLQSLIILPSDPTAPCAIATPGGRAPGEQLVSRDDHDGSLLPRSPAARPRRRQAPRFTHIPLHPGNHC